MFKKEDQTYNLISYINEDDNLTLREVLLDKLNFSVRYVSKLKRFKTVNVNKNFKKLDKKVKKGDLIEVSIQEDMANFKPQDLNLDIVYDDFDLIVVNKPPFMVVHPTKSHFENTMANGVTDYIVKKGEAVKIRFVNRLDMNTSGLVIVAKNPFAQHVLSSEMKEEGFDKKYITIVKGSFEKFVDFVKNKDCFVLCFEGEEQNFENAVTYGRADDGLSEANRLFDALRELDERGAKTVYARCPEISGVGLAVYNRLIRSAGFKVKEV